MPREIPQSLYVWQRLKSEALTAALDDLVPAAGNVALRFLAGEIEWTRRESRPRWIEVQSTIQYLERSRHLAAVPVFRIATLSAVSEEEWLQQFSQASKLIAFQWRKWDVEGMPARRIEIDFDCLTRDLSLYRRALAQLQGDLPGVKIEFTAIEDWLNEQEFYELAREFPGFTLQLHSLRRVAGRWVLFDPAPARLSLRRAGAARVPFRVALPTYAYLAWEDRAWNSQEGIPRLHALMSEGPQPTIAPGSEREDRRWVSVRAEPAELADFVRELVTGNFPGLQEIAWFRLPVKGERNNWSAATLREVMQGHAPRKVGMALHLRRTEVVAEMAGGALFEVEVENPSDQNVPLPRSLEVKWTSGVWSESEALMDYRLERSAAGHARLSRAARDSLSPSDFLKPNEKRILAWFRLEGKDIHDPYVQSQD